MTMEGNNMEQVEQTSLFDEMEVAIEGPETEEEVAEVELSPTENAAEEEAVIEQEEKELMYRGVDNEYTETEWNTPVFGGGPTRGLVEQWKGQFGKIFMVPFDHETYIIRGLTRPEYREIQLEKAKTVESNEQEPLEKRLAKKFDNEELVASICTLWPEHAQSEEYFMNGAPAGTSGTMAEMIYDKSAFRALTPPIAL